MSSRSEDRTHAFPSTRWSRILAVGGARDLEALARAYWGPIQAYLAARFRLSDDAAADLTQEAFAWMLATGLLDRADPARGRFRGLLKTALGRFALEHLRKQEASKRGGGRVHEPIDHDREPPDRKTGTPEEALDEHWRRDLLERARALLEADLEAGGRGTYYLVFRDYFLEDGDEPDHATLAARYGITRADVSNWLDYAKRRYRALLRSLVLETVTDQESYAEELRWLFGPGAAPAAQDVGK